MTALAVRHLLGHFFILVTLIGAQVVVQSADLPLGWSLVIGAGLFVAAFDRIEWVIAWGWFLFTQTGD